MRGLQGKVAIVSGGANGIGAAIVRRLVEEAVAVAIFDLDAESGTRSVQQIKASGANAFYFKVDISDNQGVVTAVSTTTAELGPVDILVNCAGWEQFGPFMQTEPSLWTKLLNINLLGHIQLTHAVLADMIERQAGKIINIASDAGRVGSTGEAVYSAAKGGLLAFTKTIAREMARYAINVNAICPGPTRTALLDELTSGEKGQQVIDSITKSIPFRRLGQPEDIAGAVAFMASSDADFITGQVLSVSGGLTMVG